MNVTIIGSINMDLTVTTDRVPDQGETVLGKKFATYPGGKGANQAVASARLGADVHMIGAVGHDPFGTDLKAHLLNEGVDVTHVSTIQEASTGTATIIVCDNDNRIIVAPGANAYVTPEYMKGCEALLKESDMLLVQLEIPIETVEWIAGFARAHHIPLIVNPAPIQPLPESIVEGASFFTPNEREAESLQVKEEKLITTLGAQGVSFTVNGNKKIVEGFSVEVRDTTGAGDTFNGALATLLASGSGLEEACLKANVAAALSVQKEGAQGGMPTLEEVEAFIRRRST
ncbi:ribokinase [Halobacillus litoralis]|uniref:ribokinase n=1 Tax=Halobacillus litoralis TaxID=45668 RepID=UPI001CD3046D|nr:ribokinase [Halobacillus litoralis]MCA0972145.1 ribokinase [Halobacillus litoralis]